MEIATDAAHPEVARADGSDALEPFMHGPFLVEPDGALHPTGTPRLRFAWRGRGCEALLNQGKVRLSAEAGAVPYTAERRAERQGVLALIHHMPNELPEGWRLCVRPDHRLELETEQPLPAPTTAVGLVRMLVGFALAVDPYLERLEAAGVAGTAGVAAGMANT